MLARIIEFADPTFEYRAGGCPRFLRESKDEGKELFKRD